jgi:hypothetical protein
MRISVVLIATFSTLATAFPVFVNTNKKQSLARNDTTGANSLIGGPPCFARHYFKHACKRSGLVIDNEPLTAEEKSAGTEALTAINHVAGSPCTDRHYFKHGCLTAFKRAEATAEASTHSLLGGSFCVDLHYFKFGNCGVAMPGSAPTAEQDDPEPKSVSLVSVHGDDYDWSPANHMGHHNAGYSGFAITSNKRGMKLDPTGSLPIGHNEVTPFHADWGYKAGGAFNSPTGSPATQKGTHGASDLSGEHGSPGLKLTRKTDGNTDHNFGVHAANPASPYVVSSKNR